MNEKVIPFPGKTYPVGGKTLKMRPLSFFEVLDLPDLFINVLDSVGEENITGVMIAQHAKMPIKELLARCLDITVDELGELPADKGMQLLADFLEMNLNENFCEALGRAVAAGKEIYTRLRKS